MVYHQPSKIPFRKLSAKLPTENPERQQSISHARAHSPMTPMPGNERTHQAVQAAKETAKASRNTTAFSLRSNISWFQATADVAGIFSEPLAAEHMFVAIVTTKNKKKVTPQPQPACSFSSQWQIWWNEHSYVNPLGIACQSAAWAQRKGGMPNRAPRWGWISRFKTATGL